MGTLDDGDNDPMADVSLNNRYVLLAMAILLSMGGTQVYQKANPESVRPDAWTKSMDEAAMAKMELELTKRIMKNDDSSRQRNEEQGKSIVKLQKSIQENHEQISLVNQKIDYLINQHAER